MLQGGIYFFQLMDHFVVTTAIIYITLFEVIAICWLFGTDRLCQIIHQMTNRTPSLYFRYCWLVAAPLIITVGYNEFEFLSLKIFRFVECYCLLSVQLYN